MKIKAVVSCPEDAKKLARSTLELIELVQDSFEPMPQIVASWNHNEINEQSFRRLACYAYILLEEMA